MDGVQRKKRNLKINSDKSFCDKRMQTRKIANEIEKKKKTKNEGKKQQQT